MPACLLLGAVSQGPTLLSSLLPRTVDPQGAGRLGRGLACWSGEGPWQVHLRVARAGVDGELDDVAAVAQGEVFVQHGQRHVSARVSMADLQPVCRQPWVFAHVGPVDGLNFARSSSSAQRRRELGEPTDGEVLFAYLLSCLDAAGGAPDAQAVAVACAMRELAARAPSGGGTFVLSDGKALYAYRSRHPLFVLDGGASHRLRTESTATLVASSPLNDQGWRPLLPGELLQVRRDDGPTLRVLDRNAAVDSQAELPFTD